MWHTHSHHDSSKVDHKGHKVGGGSIPENPHPFPEMVGIILLLFSYKITQPIKTNHAVFQGCSCHLRWLMLCLWSVFLSK